MTKLLKIDVLNDSDDIKVIKDNVDGLSVHCIDYSDYKNEYILTSYNQCTLNLYEAFFKIYNQDYFVWDNYVLKCVKSGTYSVVISFENKDGQGAYTSTYGLVINGTNQQNTSHCVTHTFSSVNLTQRARFVDVIDLSENDTITLGIMPVGSGVAYKFKIDIVYLG